ncbi:MAG: hypothetical protein MJA30_00545 [Cytophagales bacterium]|nr:hypothetical protein [Cytophagales bacterium]
MQKATERKPFMLGGNLREYCNYEYTEYEWSLNHQDIIIVQFFTGGGE